jgi:adenylate cyclase
MDEQLKNGLLTLAIEVYQIGYLLLTNELRVQAGNKQVSRWLERPLSNLINCEVTEAFGELIGSVEAFEQLDEGSEPYRLEEIYRPSPDGMGYYFDLQVIRLSGEDQKFLLTTVDVTHKARQEQLLQQQRNEVKLISAELTLANERLSYILNRLVPTSVAQSMMSGRNMPVPGGELQKEATILFADMRDFTAYAEAYQPSDTLEFLNAYLTVVSEAILRHEGSLVQLVGDMVMGVFNIPEEQPDHAIRAVHAAIDIQQSLRSFNQIADSRYPTVSFGVGISTGTVISGYLGIQQRFRYAVVGDATNVAFHLSSLAAAGRILLSESTVEAIGDNFAVLEKGDMQLKRRRKLVKVFEMSSLSSLSQPDAPPKA